MTIGQGQLGQWVRIACATGVLVLVGVMLMTTPLGEQLWGLLREPSAERLSQALPRTAVWLAVAIIGLMVLHTLIPLPAEPLAMVAGMTLGPFWGFMSTWFGAMLGALLGFFLARALGQPFIQHMIAPQRLRYWLERLQHLDIPLLLAIRLLPVISFNLINYALGLSLVGWWRFTWTTSIGIIPGTLLMVVFGAYLRDWRILVLTVVVAALIGIGGVLLMRTRGARFLPGSMHNGREAHDTCSSIEEGV